MVSIGHQQKKNMCFLALLFGGQVCSTAEKAVIALYRFGFIVRPQIHFDKHVARTKRQQVFGAAQVN